MLPWQELFCRKAFAPTVSNAALSVARGNGKTTLLSGIGCAALDGPLAVPRGEVVIVASSYAQGRIAFEHCLAFLQPAIDEAPWDWSIQDSANVSKITYKPLGTKLTVRGSDPRRAHGLAPSLILADEPGQWLESTSKKMLAALTTSLGKVPNSRMVALGTMPEDASHWFSTWCGGFADYSQVYQSKPDANAFSKATWKQANPSLMYMPTLEQAIRADSKRARLDSTALQSFKALRLNLGVADTGVATVLDAEVWRACETSMLPDMEGGFVLGIDLGSNSAMSGAAAFWPLTGRLEACAFFPLQPDLVERGKKDSVGDLYERMKARGELYQAGQRTVDVTELMQEVTETWGKPYLVCADSWRFPEIADALDACGFPDVPVELRRMGFKDGGEDLRLFRKAAIDGDIHTPESLLMRSALAGARTVSDTAGNRKIAKGKESSERKDSHKDDALMASCFAVSGGTRNPPQVRTGRGYLGLIG